MTRLLRPIFHSMPLQRLLVLTAVSQILGTVSLVGYLSFKNGQKAVEDLGNQLIDAVNYRVEQKLQDYLAIPHVINELNADAVKSGLITLDNPTLLEYRLWNQLQAFTSVSYIYISSVKGGSVAAGKSPNGQPVIERTETYPNGGDYVVFGVDDNGDRTEVLQVIPNQNATSRPWFRRPIAQQKPVWIEPFNYVDRESILAISASQPLYSSAGDLQGVATVDLELNRISNFLNELAAESAGSVFVMDRKGQLMGTSSELPITTLDGETARVIKAEEINNLLIRQAAQGITQTFGSLKTIEQQRTTMTLAGQPYFIQINPWQDEFGLNWLIVVMVPESNFMAQIQAGNRTTALLCLAAVALSAGLAVWTARRISAPVLELSAASQTLLEASRQKFANGKLNARLTSGGINEIRVLATSFEQMSDHLQMSYAQLEDYSQSLEVKVKERTEALEKEIRISKRATAQLLASEHKYRTLHEGIQDAVLLLNAKEIVDCNLTALRIFGCDRKPELYGKTPVDFSPDSQPDGRRSATVLASIMAKVLQSETCNFEWMHQRKNGQPFPAEVWLTAVTIEGEPMVQAVVKDITVRKRAEAEIIRAKEEAEVANRAKSRFLANMSHELRSPLNAILGFAQIIERSDNLSAEHSNNIGIISRSGEHLLSLINNVLDMSKIEAGRTTLAPVNFNLHQLLDDLRDMFWLSAREKQLRLTFSHTPDLPTYVRADQGKLRQILINLINNAIKFTDAGSVTVKAGLQAGSDDTSHTILSFEIIDTGVGIAANELKQVVAPFVQSQSTQGTQEGTGLGLSISEQFVKLMGGEMTIESQEQSGTRVAFMIQAAIAENIPLGETVSRRVIALAAGQPSYRILIVDDKRDNRKLMVKLFEPLGLDLKEAQNGQAAVAICHNWQPHLVWMDLRMPVMDGFEATRQIRQTVRPQNKGSTKSVIPKIIALSASSFQSDQDDAIAAGCDAFIRKPFRTDEIFETMAQQLGLRYRYASEPTEKGAKAHDQGSLHADRQITGAALAVLSTQQLNELEAATLRLQWDRISLIIDSIQAQDANLAAALTGCIHDFRYRQILAGIQSAKAQA
ncbi:MAG: ATP-binding protein [Phormidesmis sp.]